MECFDWLDKWYIIGCHMFDLWTQRRLAIEATNGEILSFRADFCLRKAWYLLNSFILALGKVPGPETEIVSLEGASLSELECEEAVCRAQLREDISSKHSQMQEVSSRY